MSMPGRTWQAVAFASLLGACAGHPPPPVDPFAGHPPRTANTQELVRAIDADAAAVQALRGKISLELVTGSGVNLMSCRGTLAARNPWSGAASPGLYLQGTRPPFPTLFTLVSDGKRFWLHLPSQKRVYTGPVDARALPTKRAPSIGARDLFRALFVEPLGDGTVALAEEPEAYVLSVSQQGQVRRRLWVERRRFAVEREVYYGGDGREEVAIERTAFVESGGRVQPEQLEVRDARGASIRLTFDEVSVNPSDLDPRTFRPDLPPGAHVVEVGGPEEAPAP